MKKSLLLFLCAILSVAGYAQVTFAPMGATWNFYPNALQYRHFRTDGTVTIAGKSCARTSAYEHDAYAHTTKKLGWLDTYTSGDTVYYRGFSGRLVPLYIFNVQQGDTLAFYKLNFYNATDSFFHVRIDSVKPVQWGNAMLKTVWARTIEPASDGTWCAFGRDAEHQIYVERIGAVYGEGLLPWTKAVIPETIGSPTCYYDGVTDVRLGGSDSCTGIPLTVTQQQPGDFNVFPNPARDAVSIQFSTPQPGTVTLALYNVIGRKYLEREITAGTQKLTIPMNDLPPGTYYISIRSEAGAWFKSIIKE
jgi:hypothetical protein